MRVQQHLRWITMNSPTCMRVKYEEKATHSATWQAQQSRYESLCGDPLDGCVRRYLLTPAEVFLKVPQMFPPRPVAFWSHRVSSLLPVEQLAGGFTSLRNIDASKETSDGVLCQSFLINLAASMLA